MLVCLVLGLVLLLFAFDNKLVLRTYSIDTDKLNGASLRMVLIADLHSTIYGSDQQPLIQGVLAQKPDLIVLTGDIADDEVPIKGTELFLAGIAGVAPIYYVTGNHEYWSDDLQTILDTISSYGVQILSDEYREIELNGVQLTIAGVEDPAKPAYNQAESMAQAFVSLPASDFSILLAPERLAEYIKHPFDLVLSGHAHGGQARVPLLINGLFAPNQGPFPKYAGGLYKHGVLQHVVSRGAGIDPILPRLFNPPEIVLLVLE
ncbi:MAG: metallophosphoesterase [Deferribacteraceae bacterium]|nr:metallophosphoesterase [Deferribacteraceae bacterium]